MRCAAASLIEVLGVRFPVVKRLVGDKFFHAMAHAFVLREPPFSPLLIQLRRDVRRVSR